MGKITRPPELIGPAKDFWDRHSAELINSDRLTELDVDGFTLLCRVHGALKTCDPITDGVNWDKLTKQFIALSKQFGMLPRERQYQSDRYPRGAKGEFHLA